MNIKVTNVGTDSYKGDKHLLGVNAIDVSIGDFELHLPMTVPNKVELSYAEVAGDPLKTPLFQYVAKVNHISAIRSSTKRNEIGDDYRNIISKYTDKLGDFYLQFPQDNNLRQTDRSIIHDIERNSGSKILTDYEVNRNQSEISFENDILALRDENPDYIVSPTLDMGIKPEELFAKKLEKIIQNGFDRFSVIYRSTLQNINNWIDLSIQLFGKNIWCNVIGIPSRWSSSKEMISTVSSAFLFGPHTVAMGYAWRSIPKVRSFTMNANTHRFQLRGSSMTYEQSRTETLNTLHSELLDARRHIIKGTFFKKYVPSKEGLNQYLNSIT